MVGPLYAEPDPIALLKLSDQARGGGLPGLTWYVNVLNTGNGDDDQSMRLRIKATDSANVAETFEPLRSKGTKMLQVDYNMWLSKPGLKKPIPISPRQRLTGQAAIGDIAATNYVRDYTVKLLRDEMIGKEHCNVLELTANNHHTTYDRLLYWISDGQGVGIRAEFYSLSGKLLKRAEFEYKNRIEIQGKPAPFISRMVITDALTDARTTLDYSQVKVQPISPGEFDVSHLE
ncbi:MAG: outer membrane lipoprotein-sorting protein [Desulfocapsa sp.]|nr:outer membrane lipoprotein-sorting protein [Desulfocapsa sp.]